MTRRGRRQRLDSLHEIAEQLRQSAAVPAPDLTDSILDRVHARREFLDRPTRGMLWVGRAAIGGSVAMVVLTVALIQRWAPGSLDLVARPAPLSTVVETVKSEATGRLGELRLAVDQAVASTGASQEQPGTAGGLLSLVSIAAPPSDHASRCVFCGPVMPPAAAARLAPVHAAPDQHSSARPARLGSKALAGGTAGGPNLPADRSSLSGLSVRARFGTTSAILGPFALDASAGPVHGRVDADRGLCRPVLRTLSLNELAPLGAGGPADSALAPK